MFSKMTFLTPPSHTGVQIEFFVLKNQKKMTSIDCKHVFQKKMLKKQKTDVRVAIGTFMEKNSQKNVKKNFFNQSVNLNTKFSKKSIFDENDKKYLPINNGWK